jgi:hypothetical protein
MTKFRFPGQLIRFLFLTMAIVVAGTLCGNAQTSTGQIKGIVTDASGAVVPGAQVTAVSLDTGFKRATVSRADGSFLIPLLDPSRYSVEIVAKSFERLVQGPITVQVTETADLGHVVLTVGSATATVTVTSQEELLQTEDATLGKVFDSTLIEALPLSTRNFTQLLSLQAGVSGAIPGTLALGNGTSQFSVGGGRVYDNAVNLDGVNAVSSSSSGSFSVPSPDALDEFKMQTGNYSAEYGRAGSGSVDVTTKSGTNKFHGDGFYFFRNKALDANAYFAKQADIIDGTPNVAADIRQAQWGGTVGGPIKKDKLFFFFSYQSTDQINGNAGTIINAVYPLIPTGDRSNSSVFAAELGKIYGGETGLLANVEKVADDGSNINPVSLALLQAKLSNGNYVLPSFPAADIDHTGRTDISYAHFSLNPTYNEKQYMGNLDYKLTPRQTITGKFFDSHSLFQTVDGYVPGFTSLSPNISDNTSVTHTFTLSPSLVNEVKLGFLRQYGGTVNSNGGLTATQIGMKPAPDAEGAFPQFLIALDGLIFPNSSGVLGVQTENQFSIGDTVSKTIGRHNMRFGGLGMDHELDLNSRGAGAVFVFTMADLFIGEDAAHNGSPFSNLLLSAAGTGSFERDFRFKDVGFFYQDDYKVRPNLTVNLGLRWDYYAWPDDTKGRMDNFVASRIGEGQFGIPNADQGYTGYTISSKFRKLNPNFTIPGGVATVSSQDGLTPNYKNFAPRVGFAWNPEKDLSVRGGFGLFFTRTSAILAQALVSGPPFNNSDLYSFGSEGTIQDPFSFLNLPPDSAYPLWTPRVYNAATQPSLLFNAAAEKIGNPYTEQWNLNIQQQFARDFLFELAYQGQNGVKLLEGLSQNQAGVASPSNPIRGITNNLESSYSAAGAPGPETSGTLNIQDRSPVAGLLSDEGLAVTGTTASSHYNALEATLNKRFSYGLQFLSAFTWSKNMDSDTVGYGGVGSAAVPPNDNTTTHHMSISGLDRTARFTTSGVYNLPTPVKNKNGFLGHALGGYGLSGVFVTQTGGPISFQLSNTTSGTSAIKLQGNLTASLAPGKTLNDVAGHGAAKNRLNNYFNTTHVGDGSGGTTICQNNPQSALMCPTGVNFGNLPTNTWLRNPGQKSVDLALTKTTRIFEGYNIEIRADFFNAFNWVNFGGPDAGIADATFGVIQSTTVDPRVIQASAKFKF